MEDSIWCIVYRRWCINIRIHILLPGPNKMGMPEIKVGRILMFMCSVGALYTEICKYTWTPTVCRIRGPIWYIVIYSMEYMEYSLVPLPQKYVKRIVFWETSRRFGPFFCIVLGSRYTEICKYYRIQ